MSKAKKTVEKVTQVIIDLLENGELPPWKTGYSPDIPRNMSGRPYRGMNVAFLWAAMLRNKWDIPIFLTYRQAKKLNGNVIKGQKGTPIGFYKKVTKTEEKDGEEKTRQYFLLRDYTVFNIAQCENLDWSYERKELSDEERYTEAEYYLHELETPVTIMENQANRNFYSPRMDFIGLVPFKNWDSPEEFYSTAFHELIHATGHPNRLNRFDLDQELPRFGSENYSKEELIAEMGAAFLCAFTGIKNAAAESLGNNAAYIKGWLKVLKNDRKLLMKACTRAQQAFDYIIGWEQEEFE